MLSLLLAVGAAGLLSHGPEITLPGNAGTVQALANDGQWTYAATDLSKLVKVNMNDVTDYGVAEISDFDSFYTIAIHPEDTFFFVTAQVAAGANKGQNVLLKVNKSTLQIAGSHTFTAAQNIPYATSVDESYVYCGMYTAPGMVIKISKSTLTEAGAVQLLTGEDDIRSLEISSRDPNHLYANTNTVPGRVVKIDVTSMTRVASTGPIAGANNLLAGTEDKDFIYVGTNTNPGSVAMILKADMSVRKVLSVTGCGNIAGMINDASNIYATCYNYPGKIALIPKDEGRLNKPATVTRLDQEQPAAITGGGNGVFIGTKTGLIKMLGWVDPVDCELNEWTAWGACSATCNGGFKKRVRDIKIDASHGGAECAEYQQRQETQVCNTDVICPEECHMGMVWSTDATDVTKTCNNLLQEPTESGKSKCVCPSNRPIFHNNMCASATVCEGPKVPCEHTTCTFYGGRIKVQHHRLEERDSFHCHHTIGRMGGCQCLCHDHVGES